MRMFHQPESTSTSLAENIPPVSSPTNESGSGSGSGPEPTERAPRIPRWLVRVELVLRVMLKMYIGLAVCYAPWSPMFWDQNPLFLQFPTLGVIAANGAVRGLVSGLGLLTLWVAVQDVIQSWNQ